MLTLTDIFVVNRAIDHGFLDCHASGGIFFMEILEKHHLLFVEGFLAFGHLVLAEDSYFLD